MDANQHVLNQIVSQAQSPESLIALIFTGIFTNSVVSAAPGQQLFGSSSYAFLIGFITLYAAFLLAAKFGSFLGDLIGVIGYFALEWFGIV